MLDADAARLSLMHERKEAQALIDAAAVLGAFEHQPREGSCYSTPNVSITLLNAGCCRFLTLTPVWRAVVIEAAPSSTSPWVIAPKSRWRLSCAHDRATPRCLHHPLPAVKDGQPPSGSDWAHEIKHDGYRLMVCRDGMRVRCFTKNSHDWADRFPAIVEAARKVKAASFYIDGEVAIRRRR